MALIGRGALPTVLPSGVKIAAPMVNRVGATIGQGALAGGIFGAATSSTNEEGMGQNALEGAVAGGIAGPVVAGARIAGGAAIKGLKNVWSNSIINDLTQNTGINPKAAKNIIQRLDDAGYTPETAQQEVTRLGPKATLADLDVSLQDEVRGVAQLGGTPTSVLKNTYQSRAAEANNEAVQIMNRRLGPTPDIEVERAKILEDAQNAVSSDYATAHKSPQKLDVSGVVADIDSKLENAVDEKASLLQRLKGFLYKNDAQGNPVLKTDVASLHEVRQGIDHVLSKLKQEGTSQTSSVYRAANDIRSQVDAQLKTNPEMAAADAKFAERMNVREGLDIGYEALKAGSGPSREFAKEWSAALPETQEKIARGMRAYIGDLMNQAQRGELAGVQQLLGKKSANREKVQLALGNQGTLVLDDLEKEAAFRSTEKAALTGSHTAANLAIANRYKGMETSGFLKEAIKGATLDLVTGSPAVATSMNALRSVGTGGFNRLLNIGTERMSESSADLLSRQGALRDNALDVLNAVQKVYGRNVSTRSGMFPSVTSRLPVIGAPVAKGAYEKLNE